MALTTGSNNTPTGQQTSANSSPVVVASDQSAIPVSGTVTANAGSGVFAISASALPLPTGASTAAKQPALGTAGTASTDVLTVQGIASMIALKVDGSGVTQPISGSVSITGTPTVTANAGTGTFAVSATALPLPTGAATSALQTTGNTSLATIATNIPAQGQALAAASMPVVLPAAQITTLTPPTTVTVTQATGTNLHTVIDSGTVSATQSGTWSVTNVSGTVSLPTGASTSALQTSGNTSLTTIATNTIGLVQTQSSTTSGQNGPLSQGAVTTAAPTYTTGNTNPLSLTTAGALRVDASATTQPVSGTVTANAGSGTFAISAASLPLPTGAATSAKQPALGTAGTASTDVITVQGIASMTALKVDGSAVTQPVSGSVSVSNFPATQPVSGTVTANAGTNLNTSALALDTSVNGILVAQGSTTTGEKGPLIQGAVTTAAPTYTTAQTSPLSLNTSGGLRVDGSGVTQPVSGSVTATISGTPNVAVTSLPSLPAGSNAIGSVSVSNFPGTQAVSGTVTANAGTGTFAVSAASLPLPTGASTSALQTTGNTSLATIATNTTGTTVAQASTTSGQVGQLMQGAVTTAAPTYTTAQTNPLSLTTAGALRVDASSTTQPVSGTVTARLNDGSGTSIGSTGGALNVNISSGTVTATNPSVSITGAAVPASGTYVGMNVAGNLTGLTGTANGLKVDGSAVTQPVSGTVTANAGTGTFAVSAAALPLPTGAATSALQTTGNTSLATIATNIPAQGQALAAASMPVVLPAAQITTLTPPTTVTVTQATGTNLHAVIDSGTVAATQSGTWNITNVSGTVSLPTGAATSALQTTGNTSLSTIATNTTGLIVTQGSTTSGQSGQLQMGAVTTASPTYTTAQSSPLSLTTAGALRVDASATTQPISASSLPLPAGAATSANQTTEISVLNTIATNTGAQATDTIASGTITALNGAVLVGTQGAYTVSASITGTWVATLIAEGQLADNTWVQLPMYVVQTTTPYPQTLTVTSNSSVLVTGGGYINIRIRASAFTSGTIAVALDASLAQQTIFTAQLGSWTSTVTQATGSNLHTVIDSGSVSATQSGTWTTGVTQATASNLNAQVVGNVASGSADSGNGIKISGVYNTTVPALTAGNRGDIQIDARGAQQVTMLDGSRATYSASNSFAVANTPTDIFTITGSASKTIRILRVTIAGTQTTASAASFQLIKRSSANTGGTSSAVTAIPHDSNSAAASATALSYTVNPTGLGTAVGTLMFLKKEIPTAAFANSDYAPLIIEFGTNGQQAVVLRGTSQVFAVSGSGVTLAGNTMAISVTWTEE